MLVDGFEESVDRLCDWLLYDKLYLLKRLSSDTFSSETDDR